jgi:MFS transporter (putative signal transducer)
MTRPVPSSLPRLLVAAGGVYTAQSLVGGLTFLGLPAVLRAENVALDRIGLVSLVMLVWVLKFLWAAPVERLRLGRGGRRRSRRIIIVGEVVVALALIVIGFNGEASFNGLLALLILMAIASATVDIVCDAFLIEQFPELRRGLANMAQVGGGYLGMIFGSGLFVWVVSASGWQQACFMLSGIVLLLSLPIAITREETGPALATTATPGLLNGLRNREVRIGIAMTIAFELGGRIAQALAGPLLIDAGLSLATLGLVNGVGGVAAGLCGTVIGGIGAQRLGPCRAMLAVSGLGGVTLGLVALAIVVDVRSLPLLVGLFVLQGAVMAAGFVVSYARLMSLASPSQPGVDFTLFQCASAIAAAFCGLSAGLLAARAGYAAAFGLAALAAAAAIPLLVLLERRLNKGSPS